MSDPAALAEPQLAGYFRCSAPIPPERLEAVPSAVLCVPCAVRTRCS